MSDKIIPVEIRISVDGVEVCLTETEIVSEGIMLLKPGRPKDQPEEIEYPTRPSHLNCLGTIRSKGIEPEILKWLIERLHFKLFPESHHFFDD